MTSHLLIGSGVAAVAAAETIRKLDEQAVIELIAQDPAGYYSRPGLAYVLSGEVNEKMLFPFSADDFRRLGVRLHSARATRILPAQKMVELDGGSTRLAYDRLLIATGARAIRLNVPGADLEGVFKLDTMEDARRLIRAARPGRSAVVTGGGITALELAEGLAARQMSVHYVLRGERYWPGVLEESESRIVENHLQRMGIRLHHKQEVAEVLANCGKVGGVRLKSGELIPCDLLAFAIGIEPQAELAREAGIQCDRGILVDAQMQTNLPGIYAAGDVAQVYDETTGQYVLDSLWPEAREQGRMAGRSMAGKAGAYHKTIPINVTRLAGLTTTIIGRVGKGHDADLLQIARGDSETWRQMPDTLMAQTGFEVNHLRLVLGADHILGALVMGDQRLSSPLQKIISRPVDIRPIRARLLEPGAPIADILADFWNELQTSSPTEG